MDMDIHGMLRPQLTINSASMPGFNADQSTVGSEHRRAGPPHLQQTHWFPGSQAVTYGPYDPIPEFGNSDAFVNQADEIDRHRQLLSGRTPIPGAPFAGSSMYDDRNNELRKNLTDLYDSTGAAPVIPTSADYAFASNYFGRPIRVPSTLDGALATSPATTYLDHSLSSPPTSGPPSLTFRSPARSRSSSSDENNFFSPTPTPSRGMIAPPQRRAVSLLDPTIPGIPGISGLSGPHPIQPPSFNYIEGLRQRAPDVFHPIASAERRGLPSGLTVQQRLSNRPRAISAAVPALSRFPESLTMVEEESDWENDG